jgi:hypothetical protein
MKHIHAYKIGDILELKPIGPEDSDKICPVGSEKREGNCR